MRRTRDYEILQFREDAARVSNLVHPRWLTTARFEPIFREKFGSGILDLVFERDEAIVVVHAIQIDMLALATLEGPVLEWPHRFPVADPQADAIEEFVFPWLRTLVRGRTASSESIRSYAPSTTFEHARERGFRGAAPLGRTLVEAAPFVYARRFAVNASVRIACSDAYHAAATLGDIARAVDIDFTVVQSDDLARRWYGDPRLTPLGQPDVAIVETLADPAAHGVACVVARRAEPGEGTTIVPEPIPCDHLFTFDPADAPEASRFSVRAQDIRVVRPARSASAPLPAGGSGGTIAIVLREDASYAPDADTEGAYELARRLRAEGLSVTTIVWNQAASLDEADLVHIVGAIGASHVTAAMSAARSRSLPFVLSLDPLVPSYSRYEEETILAALRLGQDEEARRLYLAAFYGRKLRIDGIAHEVSAKVSEANDRAFDTLAASATMILLEFTDDPDAFVRRFPAIARDRVSHRGVLIPDEPAEGFAAALLPTRPFVLAHAPFIQRSNLAALLAATNEADIQLVVAGPVSDVDLTITLRRTAARDTIVLPDPDPGVVAALYRRATAIVDMSLRPAGAGRLLRGALCGAIPIVSLASPLAPIAHAGDRFDSTDPSSIVRVLRAAIERPDGMHHASQIAARLASYTDQRSALHDVLAAYARAAAPDRVL
ncbi:MAG: hypothetical protein NVS3B28_23330 [Candidatus Velthaea sp.]